MRRTSRPGSTIGRGVARGYRFIHYGGAGTWWSEGGLNEAGLGMVLNGPLPGEGAAPDSVPTLPLARGVLQHCATVQESIEWLARYDVMYLGFNLMLADRSGDLACVEVVPGAQGVGRPEGDSIIHTNHCLYPETGDVTLDEQTLAEYGYPGLARNSESRYLTLDAVVPRAPRTLAGMEALLRESFSLGGHQPERGAGYAYRLCANRCTDEGQALGGGGLSARGALRRVPGLKGWLPPSWSTGFLRSREHGSRVTSSLSGPIGPCLQADSATGKGRSHRTDGRPPSQQSLLFGKRWDKTRPEPRAAA